MGYKTKEPNGSRSSIWLSEPLRTWVAAEAQKNNTTAAEVIRTAVRELKARSERRAANVKE